MVKKAPFGEETSSEFPHKKWWESSEDLGFSDMNIIIYIYIHIDMFMFFFSCGKSSPKTQPELNCTVGSPQSILIK